MSDDPIEKFLKDNFGGSVEHREIVLDESITLADFLEATERVAELMGGMDTSQTSYRLSIAFKDIYLHVLFERLSEISFDRLEGFLNDRELAKGIHYGDMVKCLIVGYAMAGAMQRRKMREKAGEN